MRPIVRGTAALLAVPALTLSALVATSAPASAAVDPAPATAAGTWLAGQLTDGLVHNEQYDFDDYGLTIDVALGLAAAGAPGPVTEISDAVAANIDAYVAPGFGTDLSAGGTAKALVLAVTAGDDPAAYGGRDLVADLESTVATEGAIAGRIQDDWDPSQEFAADYANVLGQAFAAQALDAVGSEDTDAVTDFLLQQQCDAGYFRQDFAAADAPDQTCDGGAGAYNVDATAAVVNALQSQLDDTDVAAQVDDAVAWLVGEQKPNGGFGSNADLPGVNANSTGAAGYALLLAGEDEAAVKAAAWLRAHQLTNVANCVYYDAADTGAVVYDNAARKAAQGGPMDAPLNDQSVRATAEALPGLLAAQTGDPFAIFAGEYVKAGGVKPIGVGSAAPGEALCAMLGEQSVLAYADPRGDADVRVRVPQGTAKHEVSLANAGGVFATVEVNALGKQKLGVSLAKSRVAVGAKQTVTIWKLAPAETATVKVGATKVQGQANAKGVLKATFTVIGKPGRKTVKVAGAFQNRTGTAQFTVTR